MTNNLHAPADGRPSSDTGRTFALVLAGGSGTRFWPLSRDARPKQLLELFGESSLLQQTIGRLAGLVPNENILVLTNATQEAGVRAALPQLPPENIIPEPVRRDTAPAIAFGIGWVAARDPGAQMMVLPADHLIADVAAYQRVMRGALHLASNSDALVTVGIRPTWACPAFGYIERGSRVATDGAADAIRAYRVNQFREKPCADVAAEFLAQGNFLWNAGMFLWSIPSVLGQMRRHCLALAQFAETVRQSPDLPSTLDEHLPQQAAISIDYALLEHADHVLAVDGDFDWDDVGSWLSVGNYLPKDDHQNAANCQTVNVASSNNIVFSSGGLLVGLVGVEGLIVVQTDDAVLVAAQAEADKIKELVPKLPKQLL